MGVLPIVDGLIIDGQVVASLEVVNSLEEEDPLEEEEPENLDERLANAIGGLNADPVDPVGLAMNIMPPAQEVGIVEQPSPAKASTSGEQQQQRRRRSSKKRKGKSGKKTSKSKVHNKSFACSVIHSLTHLIIDNKKNVFFYRSNVEIRPHHPLPPLPNEKGHHQRPKQPRLTATT